MHFIKGTKKDYINIILIILNCNGWSVVEAYEIKIKFKLSNLLITYSCETYKTKILYSEDIVKIKNRFSLFNKP